MNCLQKYCLQVSGFQRSNHESSCRRRYRCHTHGATLSDSLGVKRHEFRRLFLEDRRRLTRGDFQCWALCGERRRYHRVVPSAVGLNPEQQEQRGELVSNVSEDSVGLQIQVWRSNDSYNIVIQGDASRHELRIHWAVNDWELVPEEFRPEASVQVDDLAVQTPLDAQGQMIVEFPMDSCPSKMVFVVKEGETWSRNGSGDFVVYLKPPGVDDIVTKVIQAETEYDRWSLFDRVNLATSLLDAAIAAGPEGMGLILTWLRLSSMKLLPWYKGSNYQSKDAAHAQKVLAQKMADMCCSAKDPLCRLFSRISLSTLPRGGANGDDIRMQILHIMRENGIREGHRPGIEDAFLESWHQKLHTNTTPEDITICEAYLAFLYSADMGEFWRVLWENGRMTPEYLQAMDHPINPSPFHLPHLIGPMEHYLWVLKKTHSGADLDVAFEMAKGNLDGELSWIIGDLLANRNEWWVPGKIVEARQRLSGYWKNTNGCARDILLLDIALDSYFRILIERMDKTNLSADDVINIIGLVLTNSIISSETESLENATMLWRRVFDDQRWSGLTWATRALAACDSVLISLEEYADNVARYVQPYVNLFGAKCSIDENYVLNFSEEVVRGQSVTVLGKLLQLVSGQIRESAGMGSWEIVSSGLSGSRIGVLRCMENLESIQGTTIKEPSIFLVDKLTGNEDIPNNIDAIITGQPTDVLSHIAIRARAQSVLLATCFDTHLLGNIKGMGDGSLVQASLDATGSVLISHASGPSAADSEAGTTNFSPKNFVAEIIPSNSWVLEQHEFGEKQVGGKALNLSKLREIASQASTSNDTIHIPRGLALPFGTFEKVLDNNVNANARAKLSKLQVSLDKAASGSGVPQELEQLRNIISHDLKAPEALFKELSPKLIEMQGDKGK